MEPRTIRVRLFARARELAQRGEVELPGGPMDVATLRRRLIAEAPGLASFLDRCAVAVNEDLAGAASMIRPGDEVAILPPVSGGWA